MTNPKTSDFREKCLVHGSQVLQGVSLPEDPSCKLYILYSNKYAIHIVYYIFILYLNKHKYQKQDGWLTWNSQMMKLSSIQKYRVKFSHLFKYLFWMKLFLFGET